MVEKINLSVHKIDPQIAHLLPESIIREKKLIPVKMEGNNLHIAMSNPDDIEAIDEIKLLTGNEIVPLHAEAKDLSRAISEHFGAGQVMKQALIDMRLEALKAAREKPAEIDISQNEDASPVVRLVNTVINGAIGAKASDIHIEPQEPEMRIRYRIDGVLHDIMTIPRHIEPTLISRAKLLANMDITEKRRPQDGHISVTSEGKTFDLRASTLPCIGREKMVLRILDKSAMLMGLEKCGFSPNYERVVKNLISKPYGMIFVTGPTGSGKTVTLYSMLNKLNSPTRNILTVEDPVEFQLTGINQVQANPEAGVTFASALKTFLRQDPDVIMVGEVRDKETAEIAVQAALTGHLVLSTLHTNDAPSAVVRLVDMGVEPFLISSTIIGVIAQRLARTVCPECHGNKCSYCYYTGMKGRTGIFEIMQATDTIQRLILERKSTNDIKEAAVKEGMVTLQQSGDEKVKAGACTWEEVSRVVYT